MNLETAAAILVIIGILVLAFGKEPPFNPRF